MTITAYWKVLADRTNDPKIVAHAQRGVNVADWIFTLAGIALVMIGGYGAAWVKGLPLFDSIWLVGGQILFVVSGMSVARHPRAAANPPGPRRAAVCQRRSHPDRLSARRAALAGVGHHRHPAAGRRHRADGAETFSSVGGGCCIRRRL
ncbi:MAG: DUF2269 domain-containing protein [Rhodopseudomonas palustris]|nr:DUF2269 domain-containing protein [Rhodopseudomonas palustris]